jgi:drug/metabolite transporter (DMT)-like permease
MSVLWGVAAAVLIGVSDTFGSQSSRTSTALQSVTAAFWAAAIGGLIASPFLGELRADDLVRGGISGVAAAAALWTLWRAYVVSTVGVGAPVAAVVGGAIPVAVDVVRGDEPGWIGILGIVIGLASLVLTSWSTHGKPVVPGLTLGAVAGVFFAIMFIVSADTSVDSGIWPMTSQRLVAAMIVTTFSLARGLQPIAELTSARLSVIGGIAGGAGVSAVILGGQRNPLGPIAVAASLYPAITIAAHWVLFGERLRWWQVLGLTGALAGVALIAAD